MKSSSRKSGQAALEFLVTYGWVMMTVLIMTGALIYFDVLNPENYLPEECIFGQNIICDDWSIEKTTGSTFEMNLKLKNNLEKPIIPVNITMYDRDNMKIAVCNEFNIYCPFNSEGTANWTSTNGGISWIPSGNPSWRNGKSCRLEAKCEKALISGFKETLRVDFAFRRQSGSTNHLINGKVFSKISK
ncbi:hypothetical protein CMO90_04360 [Candidatus Woesearchaeota archaeon]|nr:hypothetical protein [Candidatus Woesearchaeota archaeon]